MKSVMPEIEREAKAVIIEYACDYCPDGKMVRTEANICFLSDPPKYEHQCSHCRTIELLTSTYPYYKVVST